MMDWGTEVEWFKPEDKLPPSGSPVLAFVTLPDEMGGGRIVAQVVFRGNDFLHEFLWQGRFSMHVSHWAEPIAIPSEPTT